MKFIYRIVVFCVALFTSAHVSAQIPVNDSCHNAIEVAIGNNNFGLGTFQSDPILIDSADIQVGEHFHSSLVSSGNDKKSIWFKFYLPVRRGVDIELKQKINLN